MAEGTPQITGDIELQTEKLVQSIIPYLVYDNNTSEDKARYLGYRASGFTSREAMSLVGRNMRTLTNWRNGDAEFCRIEREELPTLRSHVGREIITLEFIRNYRMILLKDFNIIRKSLKMPEKMSQGELQYLFKARQHYTPQQLAILQQLFSEDGRDGKPADFTELVLTLRRTRTEEVQLRGSLDAAQT